jgi:DNA/RNA non-specific endonuclease
VKAVCGPFSFGDQCRCAWPSEDRKRYARARPALRERPSARHWPLGFRNSETKAHHARVPAIAFASGFRDPRSMLARALSLTLLFAGCGASRPPSITRPAPPPFAYPPVLEEDKNGADATAGGEWPGRRESNQDDEVEQEMLAEVMGCPPAFGPALRSRWYALSGEDYYIDDAGRPSAARTRLPPLLADPRDNACQGQVGRWGDEEDKATDYDGGHLIGNQLGGWGSRINLVPQEASFNRGNWAQMENALAGCDALPYHSITLTIEVEYPDAVALVPFSMRMRLEDVRSGERIEAWFPNVERGGDGGTAERAHAVAWLRALGCRPR